MDFDRILKDIQYQKLHRVCQESLEWNLATWEEHDKILFLIV